MGGEVSVLWHLVMGLFGSFGPVVALLVLTGGLAWFGFVAYAKAQEEARVNARRESQPRR